MTKIYLPPPSSHRPVAAPQSRPTSAGSAVPPAAPGTRPAVQLADLGLREHAPPPWPRLTKGPTPPAAARGQTIQAKSDAAAPSAADLQQAAQRGTAGPGGPLPHLARIQAAFGSYDVTGVAAHTDRAAGDAASAIGAEAFATGNHVAFAGPPSLHTAAHEAAHTVQQRGGVQLAGGVGRAGDVYERHADQVADAVQSGRSAEPLLDRFADRGRVSSGRAASLKRDAGVLQRKVLVDNQVARVSDDPLVRDGGPKIHWLSEATGDLGADDKNIRAMTEDGRTRYLKSEAELKDYAGNQTDSIGYVEREKTWVRLPEYLVIGESHAETTLHDIIDATGNQHYQYEGEAQKSEHLYPGPKVAVNQHAIEKDLPKMAVGLVGVEATLGDLVTAAKKKIRDTSFSFTKMEKSKTQWKGSIDASAEKSQADFVSPEQQSADYEAAVEDWSKQWEIDAAKAAEKPFGGRGGLHHGRGIYAKAPDRPYERAGAEARIAGKALKALKDSTLPDEHPLKAFYLANQTVIDATIGELDLGTSLQFTKMFKKMVTGKFDFGAMTELFKGAALAEFKESGTADVSEMKAYEGADHETTAPGHRMEELRDSYMLASILAGKQAGVRLFGIGDTHRKNLEAVLKAEDNSITVMGYEKFYPDQYKKHPDVR